MAIFNAIHTPELDLEHMTKDFGIMSRAYKVDIISLKALDEAFASIHQDFNAKLDI